MLADFNVAIISIHILEWDTKEYETIIVFCKI